MKNSFEDILKESCPDYESRNVVMVDSHTIDDIFSDNLYFEKIDKILEKPSLEPSLDRSTEIYYFV